MTGAGTATRRSRTGPSRNGRTPDPRALSGVERPGQPVGLPVEPVRVDLRGSGDVLRDQVGSLRATYRVPVVEKRPVALRPLYGEVADPQISVADSLDVHLVVVARSTGAALTARTETVVRPRTGKVEVGRGVVAVRVEEPRRER